MSLVARLCWGDGRFQMQVSAVCDGSRDEMSNPGLNLYRSCSGIAAKACSSVVCVRSFLTPLSCVSSEQAGHPHVYPPHPCASSHDALRKVFGGRRPRDCIPTVLSFRNHAYLPYLIVIPIWYMDYKPL